LRRADFGLHLTRPWRVVLFGEPNVGKSSLINALVGFERAIVFDRPGTTRDVVTAETAFDGWPVRLSDTAGLRADAEELEAAGIERTRAELAEADLPVEVSDRSRPPQPSPWFWTAREFRPRLIVLNKADLPSAWPDEPQPDFVAAVSAHTGEGIRDLMTRIVATLIPELPPDDEPIPITPRQTEALRAARTALLSHDTNAVHRHLAAISP
jgi:tRNA modification GTPase